MPSKNRPKSTKPTSVAPAGEGVFLKQRISRSTKIKIVLVGILAAIVLICLILDVAFNGPLMSLLSNRDQLVASVEKSGPFGPLLYIILQVTQTVVAPIPGQIVGSVGGFLFGPWGILWTTIGSLIGYWIVFMLARHYGRPLLEKIFKKSVIEKFDFILSAKSASLILFAIFLLPGFPDDVVCYIAGLTNLPISRLMIIVTLGRLPTIIMTNFVGAGISDNFGLVAAVSVITVFFLGIVVWKREKIIKLLKGETPSTGPKKPTNTDKD